VHGVVKDERLRAGRPPTGGDPADERDPLARLVQPRQVIPRPMQLLDAQKLRALAIEPCFTL
jgi:hypothetical protein